MGNFLGAGRRKKQEANSNGMNGYMAPLMASSVSDQPPSIQPDKAILVPLGHMAFMAYDDPVLANEDRCQTTKKPTIFFVDPCFLKKRCYGLQVRLTATSTLPKTGAYAVLSVESKLWKAHGRAVRVQAGIKSTDPGEDAEAVHLVVGDPVCDVLHVKLYDGRKFHPPKEMKLNALPTDDGECTFYLEGPKGGPDGASAGFHLHVRLLTWSSGNYTEEDIPMELTHYTLQGDKDPQQQKKFYLGRSKSVSSSSASLAAASASSSSSSTTDGEVYSDSPTDHEKTLTVQSKDVIVVASSETSITAGPVSVAHAHEEAVLYNVTSDDMKLHAESMHDLCHALDRETSEHHGAVAFVECLQTDTQVWVFINEEQRQITLAFRGTEKFRDWRTNFRFFPVGPHWLPPKSRPLLPFLNWKGIKTHFGFLGAYNSVRDTVHALVKHITSDPAGESKQQPWRAFVTGHSLGGALANLAAYDLSLRKREHEQDNGGIMLSAVTLYTFGCPRVGNQAFATNLNNILPDAWRVNNINDIVSSVPRKFWGYRHAGKNLEMKNGELTVMGDDVSKGFFWKLFSLCFVTEHLGPMYEKTLRVVAETLTTRKTGGSKDVAS